MESKYRDVERAVMRRRRRLNAWRGLRLGLTLSAGATLSYFVGVYVGLLPMLEPWWLWIGLNALGAWLGFQWGKRLPIALQRELYRVDRALGLGEVLTTIYELRNSTGGARVLDLLYRKFERLQPAIEVERALPFPPEERRGWVRSGGLTAIAFAFLVLWWVGIPPLSFDRLFPSSPWNQASVEQTGENVQNSADSRQTQSADENSQEGEDLASLPENDAKTETSSEQDCIREGQDAPRLTEDQAGDARPCRSSEGAPSINSPETASIGAREQAQRGNLQELAQALSGLLDGLRREELSPDQARRQLEDLADQAPSESLRDALERAAQAAQAEQMRQQIENALEQVREQLQGNSARDSTEGQAGNSGDPASKRRQEPSGRSSERGSEADSGGSSEVNDSERQGSGEESAESQSQGDGSEKSDSSSQGASAGEGDESASGAQPQENQGDGSSATSGADADASSESGAQSPGESNSSEDTGATSEEGGESSSGQRSDSPQGSSASQQDGAESQASGDGPGLEPGQNRPDGSSQDELPLKQDLFIQGGMLPFDVSLLDRLIVQGLPVDVAGQGPNGAPILRLDLRRVEALLDLRDLPPELRSLVREYFLALVEEGSR